MAISHFVAAALNIIFGGFSWIISRYLILLTANIYITEFPQYAAIPHLGFMISVAQWGTWLFVFIPTSIYLWTQTQRPEVGY